MGDTFKSEIFSVLGTMVPNWQAHKVCHSVANLARAVNWRYLWNFQR